MEIVTPNVTNFIASIRDIGYSLEIAIADIIDNSIAANSNFVKISFLSKPHLKIEIFDDGIGMNEHELIEAMRLGSKNPNEKREESDLGRFGLGLKTASFSQCKKLTVFTKKDGIINNRQWDLNYLEETNEWYLKTLSEDEITQNNYTYYEELEKLESGSLIVWEEIDKFLKEDVADMIDNLKEHLSLTFHKFIEKRKINIYINEVKVKAFNPFNLSHAATQQLKKEIIRTDDGKAITVIPYVLPHHSKVTETEYNKYEMQDGYVKNQGFYLYRANRLLISGTWFGLKKFSDAHKLIRIEIDIDNSTDLDWGIDVKKSLAKPSPVIREQLKRIIKEISPKGSRVYTARGKKIEDKSVERFWDLVPIGNEQLSFKLNLENEIYKSLIEDLDEEKQQFLKMYLKYIEEYIPLNAILANLQQNPHKISQKMEKTEEELKKIREKLLAAGLDEEYISKLEIFRER